MAAKEKKYIIVSGWMIREGSVARRQGGLVLFRFADGGGIRIRADRVYDSEEAAQKAVKSEQAERPAVPRRGQWGYFEGNAWHAL